MNREPFEEILTLFDSKGAEYQLIEHQPVITSDEAEAIKKSDALGLKSLLFKTDNGYVLLVMPGAKKVSSKKARNHFRVSDVRMVSPEEVLTVMGCEVGGCYPVGEVCDVVTVVDSSVLEAGSVIFNVGRRDRSVEMKREEFQRTVTFEVADLSKE